MSILCVMAHSSKGAGRASDHLRNAYNGLDGKRKTRGVASSKFAPLTGETLDAGGNELERPSFGAETFHALSVPSSPILGSGAAAGGCPQLENRYPDCCPDLAESARTTVVASVRVLV